MVNKPSIKMIAAAVGTTNTTKLRQQNAAAASFVDFIRIQGLTTIVMDTAMVASGPVGMGIRAFMFAFGGKELKGFTSDLISLVYIPLLMIGKMALNPDDEDMEDWDRWAQYYMRKLPSLGFTPTWNVEIIWAIINAMRDEDVKSKQNILNFIRPFIGGGLLVGDLASKGMWNFYEWLEK